MKTGKADKTDKTEILLRVLQYIRKERLRLAASLALSLFVVALALYAPILIGEAIDHIAEAGRVEFSALSLILWKLAAIALLSSLLQWLMTALNNGLAYGVVSSLRKEVFARLQKLPLSWLDAHPVGDIVSRITSDADQFADGLLLGFGQLFTGVATILGTLFIMLGLHPGIALAVVMLTPASLLAANFIAKRTFSFFRRQSEIRGEQTAFVEEILGNQKLVQAYAQEEDSSLRFGELNKRMEEASLKAVFFSSLTNPCTRFINSLVYAAVALFGSFAALKGEISVGVLSCFLSYAKQYAKPFNEISGVVTELQNAIACAGRLFDLLEEEPQSPEPLDAKRLAGARGRVEFRQVSFSYLPDKPLIQGMDLRVEPGWRIAIVGPTGSGKTTLINLLMRFYEVTGGEIRVEGEDIRDYTRKSLRGSFGMVLQDSWIREGSVLDNIRMGRKDATMEEVIRAAKASHAHSFIRRLPQGYHTRLSEEGGGLSQGQKQLLSIARVMLALPPMLILDEATSSIDTRTEKKIQEAFAGLMEGRTSFIVAHRLSTIRDADRILVMRDGAIAEQGTHEGLLQKKGFYWQLYAGE